MAKLPLPTRDELDDQGKAVYDKLAGPRTSLSGMYRTLLNHPILAEHVGQLGTYVRYESNLADDIRELGILATARELGAPFVWEKHVQPALKAGLPQSVIDQVLAGDIATAEIKPLYLTTWQAAQHIVHQRNIPPKTQNILIEFLGLDGLLDLTIACGLYRMITTIVFSFEVPLPEEGVAPF
ncbi:carboxymuconolactone decarboxylase family protein [Endozoicomonas sp. SM1973]|uniref:Carboxymuconolactone decarboxylase family protein n=1 Tax=Spartinivicinus marinus TaxID=2994442 RepID=A0A853IC59_9GAMM|nr:carboxymuconolactone decarboxylase family protein [Spartinivicinus marinus]MCX4028636.1 carboxymuconolactone decarboxylase family protein [Spartinivicinus marinus]NYZ67097.1 carboxymuconolactone decarboxylase family protein [Spartinivicinus marinus]